MFFKKIIQKNIKLLTVLVFVFGSLFTLNNNVYAVDSELLNSTGLLSENNGWEKRTPGSFTYKKADDKFGVFDTETDYNFSMGSYYVDTKKQGTTFEAGPSSNLAYSIQRSNIESPNGTYTIGTGKLPSGYTYIVEYDKGQNATATGDFMRTVRVLGPGGIEYMYIFTGDFKGGKATTYNKNGTDDKAILDAIAKENGDSDLYNTIVSNDTATHQQNIIDSINNTTLNKDQKTFLINKVKSGVPLTAEENALYTPLLKNTNVVLDSSNHITNVTESAAKALSEASEDKGVKEALNNKNGVFATNQHNGQCFGNVDTVPYFFVDIFNCISQIFYYILTLATMILSIVGGAFNKVFELTVINMKGFVDSVGIINVGWVAIRDIANILFIFMLLYLAIATILQLDEHGVKQGLSRLIVGAVLINFSLFFVKVPIDISNILAIEIYDKINPSNGQQLGMGDAVLSSLNFQNVYGAREAASSGGLDTTAQAQAFAQTNAPTTTFVMAMIMIATLIFLFLAVIIIFVKRLVTLMMLMIFSPLAFAGIAIPNHSIGHEINSKFWGTLLRESFYAPAFMFIMYLGLMIINSAGFKTSVFNGGTSFADGLVSVGTIINYIVVIFIFIFALTVSETIGVKGAAGAIKAFDGMRGAATGWVGKNTIGRIANSTLNKGESAVWLRTAAAGQKGGNFASRFLNQQLARGVIGATSSLGANKFGGGQSYDDKVSKREDEFKAMLDEIHDDPKKIAEILTASANDRMGNFGTDRKGGDRLFHHLSGEQKVSVKKVMEAKGGTKEGAAALKRYFTEHGHGRMTPDEALDLEKAERDKISSFDKTRFLEEAATDMTKAVARFEKFSDKQKSELLNSIGTKEQAIMLTNPKFKDLVRENLNTFKKAEKVYENASDEMKATLDEVYSDAKARSRLAEALQTKLAGDGKTALGFAELMNAKLDMAKLMEKMSDFKGKTAGKSADDLVALYNSSKLQGKDDMFVRARGNASRVFEMNPNTKAIYKYLGRTDES